MTWSSPISSLYAWRAARRLAHRRPTRQALARGGYQNLIKYPIRVTTQVYELEGTLEWVGRFDFSTVIMEGTRDFVPLYDTTLTAILIPGLRIESPAVLFNRKTCSLTGKNRKNCLLLLAIIRELACAEMLANYKSLVHQSTE